MTTLVNWITVDRITNIDSATMAEGVESWEFMGRGEAMMVPRGPWVIAELELEYDMSIGTEFDFVAFPFQGPTKAFPADTGWSMCVPKASRVADAAWAFVRYFLEPANLIQHNIACAQIPPRKSVATNPTYVNAMPFMAPILEILDYGKFIGPFNSGVLKANLTQVFISLCTNDGTYASVEAALAALESQTNAELRL
jgi:ABC-type glycerol-3-phosphate transport system substrate-binding protein